MENVGAADVAIAEQVDVIAPVIEADLDRKNHIFNQVAELDEENALQNGTSGAMGSEISDDVKADVKIEANNVVDPAFSVLRDVEQEIKDELKQEGEDN